MRLRPGVLCLCFAFLTVFCFAAPARGEEAASSAQSAPAQSAPAQALPVETPSVQTTPAQSLPPEALPQATGYRTVPLPADTPEALRLKSLWDGVMARHDPEAAFGAKLTCMPAPVRTQWNTLAGRAPKMTWTERLQYTSAFFNNWDSISDEKSYGQEEYWATPEEFLEKGGGDCEDYALAKYLALRRFSWPERDMWVLLVEHREKKTRHAVLAARQGKKIFILDNLSRPAHLLIPESQYMRTYTPLYALNAFGIWSFSPEK